MRPGAAVFTATVVASGAMTQHGALVGKGALRLVAWAVVVATLGCAAPVSAMSSMTLAALASRTPAQFVVTPDCRIRHATCVEIADDGASVVDGVTICDHKTQSYSTS